jgi:hypothetical protein
VVDVEGIVRRVLNDAGNDLGGLDGDVPVGEAGAADREPEKSADEQEDSDGPALDGGPDLETARGAASGSVYIQNRASLQSVG